MNDAFEAEYDINDYEAKTSKLMHHAYQRIRKENLEALHRWKKAIGELSKEDHYILVLCRDGSTSRTPGSFSQTYVLKLLAGIALFLVALHFLLPAFLGRYGFHWRSTPAPTRVQPVPLWAQRAISAFLTAGYIYIVVVPWVYKLYRSRKGKRSA